MQDDVDEPIGHPRGPLAQWLAAPSAQNGMTRRVSQYLKQARDSKGKLIFKERIRNMCIGTNEYAGSVYAMVLPLQMVILLYTTAKPLSCRLLPVVACRWLLTGHATPCSRHCSMLYTAAVAARAQ